MLRTIYPYVGIIQIRFWVQTIQPVLSLLTASSPFVRHYSAVGKKMQSETIQRKKGVLLFSENEFIMKLGMDRIRSMVERNRQELLKERNQR